MAPSAASTTRGAPKGQAPKMADSADPDSGETATPPGRAPATGAYDASSIEVLEGLDVLFDILASHVDEPDNPLGGAPDPPVVVNSVTIEEG